MCNSNNFELMKKSYETKQDFFISSKLLLLHIYRRRVDPSLHICKYILKAALPRTVLRTVYLQRCEPKIIVLIL
jgi:hypothetical protein